MKATRSSMCQACGSKVAVGQAIRQWSTLGWVHVSCFDSMRNRVLVNHGHTFAGTPAQYRRQTRRRD